MLEAPREVLPSSATAVAGRAGRRAGGGFLVEAGQVAVGQGADPELFADPGRHRRVEFVGVQALDGAADRRFARRDMAFLRLVVAGPEPGQRLLRQPGRVLADRGVVQVVRQQRADRDQQDADLAVADTAGLAAVTDPGQVAPQAAELDDVQLDQASPWGVAQQRGREAAGQHRQRIRVQRAQPVGLRLPVERVVLHAAAPPVALGRADADEPGRGVAGPGVPGRVGERLHRQYRQPVYAPVVGVDAAQDPPQHRRGQVRYPPGRQHAEPLVGNHVLQSFGALLRAPADVLFTDRAAQHRRAERRQRHPRPVQLGHVTHRQTRHAVAQPVMRSQHRLELIQLIPLDRADQQRPKT